MGRCIASGCDGRTVWDDDASSDVCTVCGLMTNPSQSVLDAHLPPSASSTYQHTTPFATGFKGTDGRDLPGQGKELRIQRNENAMRDWIAGITRKFGIPGSSERAFHLFRQAMDKGKFRWGNSAKIVAGATMACLLREQKQPDSLRDIDKLLVPRNIKRLNRVFTSVFQLLGFKFASFDPATYIPIIHNHLKEWLDPVYNPLHPPHPSVVQELKAVDFNNISDTALGLSSVVTRHLDSTHPLRTLPVPGVACAIYIVAMEAELRESTVHLTKISDCLAGRFEQAGSIVRQRYTILQEVLEAASAEIPWPSQHVPKKKGRGKAKLPRRTFVARAVKDIVSLKDDLFRQELALNPLPVVHFEPDDESGFESDTTTSSSSTTKRAREAETDLRPQKRIKRSKPRDQASLFLLDPNSDNLSASHASTLSSQFSSNAAETTIGYPSSASSSNATTPASPFRLPLLQYILAGNVAEAAPTRLELLALARGGSGPEHILDEELFTEDELSGMLRNVSEVEALKDVLHWDKDDNWEEKLIAKEKKRGGKGRGKNKENNGKPRIGSSRINAEAFANIFVSGMNDDKDDDIVDCLEGLQTIEEQEEQEQEQDHWPGDLNVVDATPKARSTSIGKLPTDSNSTTGQAIVLEWREASPGPGGDQYDYDQEYD